MGTTNAPKITIHTNVHIPLRDMLYQTVEVRDYRVTEEDVDETYDYLHRRYTEGEIEGEEEGVFWFWDLLSLQSVIGDGDLVTFDRHPDDVATWQKRFFEACVEDDEDCPENVARCISVFYSHLIYQWGPFEGVFAGVPEGATYYFSVPHWYRAF